jgi:Ca-activated chloride channel family protein
MTAPLPLLTEEEVHAVIRGEDDERRSFGCLRGDRGLLPLSALDVDARIVGTFAHTKVTQSFHNTSGVPVEATYIFPLPDRSAATRFTMEVAGRRVEGELQERGQARQTYDNAIRAGTLASIAEEERPGTFTLRVGNPMAGETATITLELTGALPVVDGEVTGASARRLRGRARRDLRQAVPSIVGSEADPRRCGHRRQRRSLLGPGARRDLGQPGAVARLGSPAPA